MSSKLNVETLKYMMDRQCEKYCNPDFIANDPIQIPHAFSSQQNIEVAGLFAATFAWGLRKNIIVKSKELISRMDGDPYDFILNSKPSDFKVLKGFRHRTFGEDDLHLFVLSLAEIYRNHSTLDDFLSSNRATSPVEAIVLMRSVFEKVALENDRKRSLRHIANVEAGSAAKRLNMFFRWMVRTDNEGVDFGLWKSISPSELLIPLDMHVGNVSRQLGILKRKQNDLKAVFELTSFLKLLDADDPVRYDYALFSMGVEKEEVVF